MVMIRELTAKMNEIPHPRTVRRLILRKLDMQKILSKLIHSLTRAVYRPTYIGFEHIPKTGPVIIIANHVSYVDGPVIDAGTNRNVRYIIDQDIYRLPGVNYLMKLDRAIPISPTRKSVEEAFNAISEGLRQGDAICIFPEGFLTFTGGLGRFRPGIEWIINRDPVPIVPIAISGLWGSMFSRKYLRSSLRWLPRHFGLKVKVKCGPAIDPLTTKVDVNYLQEVVLKLKYSI
jgi:1-acyl-sn-glycerol-3-phosphate acyltransferase